MDNEYRSYQHLFLARSIWKHVRLSTVHGIHRLDLLTRLPWLTSLIKNVAVELKWDPAFHESGSGENWHTEIRGELEEYLFCDRQAVLNRLVDAGYAGQDEDDPAYFEDGKLMEFTQGPDGRGFDPFIKNADDAINSLESSILRLHSLERFVWQTAVLPMPLSLCQHLSRLDTLRLLRLEQQGEFRSASEYLGMSCSILANHTLEKNACPLLCGRFLVQVDSSTASVLVFVFSRSTRTCPRKMPSVTRVTR